MSDDYQKSKKYDGYVEITPIHTSLCLPQSEHLMGLYGDVSDVAPVMGRVSRPKIKIGGAL
ncbi:hypothetical protein ACS8E2_12785 [Psychrobacter glaciei]|uniref:hypothetical protein n=1 Tax=Psychrobacter glaciei TaxID=619771 RepID=UPI003F4814FB